MKKKLMDALSAGNRMISENSNITNKMMVVSLLSMFAFVDAVHENEQVTLIYYGENPLTFLLLFIASYLFGYKVIKVLSMEQLQEKVLLSTNPIVFMDKDNYSDDILGMMKIKTFVVFQIHNVSFFLKMSVQSYIADWDYLKRQQEEYGERDHRMLMSVLKSLTESKPQFLLYHIVMELPTSGIHSPSKHIGFGKENIHSIVGLISRLPKLMAHSVVRIFSTIESSFFYMLSVYVNQKTLLLNVSSRNNLSIELYSDKQVTILDGLHMKYLWDVMIKDFVTSNRYQSFKHWPFKWIVGLKIRKLLRGFFGRSLTSLYIINADLPLDVKQLLRNSFLNVSFLYGIRETGNIIGSNFKKDKLSFDSYKVENYEDDIHIVDDEITGVLFIRGNAVSDTLKREIISNTTEEDEIYVDTQDVGVVNKGVITFLSPSAMATTVKDRPSFDLYFAEQALLLLPEIIHAVSFEYQDNWYIGVQVDESYLDRTNQNVDDVERKLEGMRYRMNTYLPPETVIRKIDVTTNDLILNHEGKPIRFVHKMEEVCL